MQLASETSVVMLNIKTVSIHVRKLFNRVISSRTLTDGDICTTTATSSRADEVEPLDDAVQASSTAYSAQIAEADRAANTAYSAQIADAYRATNTAYSAQIADADRAANTAYSADAPMAADCILSRVAAARWLCSTKFALLGKTLCAALILSLGIGCAISDAQAATSIKTKPYTNAMSGVRLRVVVEPKNPPFAILAKDVTHPVGFDIEVIYDLQRRLGFELVENRFYPVDVQQGFKMIEEGTADVLVGGLVINEDRMKTADVTSVIYSTGLSIMYSSKHTPVESPGDMNGKRLGVKFDSPAEAYIRGVSKSVPIVYNNVIMAYYAVATGEIDAVVADRPSLTYFSKLIPSFNLVVSDAVFDFYSGQFVFYMPKHSKYKDLFNQALADMQYDGTIYKLRRKWISD